MLSRALAALLVLALFAACSSTSTTTTTTPADGGAEADSKPVTTRDGGGDAEGPSDANVVDACADPRGAPTEMSTDDCIVVGRCGCTGEFAFRCDRFGPPKVSDSRGFKYGVAGCKGFGDMTCCNAQCVRSARRDGMCSAMRPDAYDCPVGAERPQTPGDCETKADADGTRETVCCSN